MRNFSDVDHKDQEKHIANREGMKMVPRNQQDVIFLFNDVDVLQSLPRSGRVVFGPDMR